MSAEACQKRYKSSTELFSKEGKGDNHSLKNKNFYGNLVYGSFWSNQPNFKLASSGCILLAPALFAKMKVYRK